MGKIERIQVSPVDRDRLHRLVKDRNTPQKVVWRAQIVLAAGDGMGSVAIAATVGKSVLTVRRWRRRYAKAGVEGLLNDATRPPPQFAPAKRRYSMTSSAMAIPAIADALSRNEGRKDNRTSSIRDFPRSVRPSDLAEKPQ